MDIAIGKVVRADEFLRFRGSVEDVGLVAVDHFRENLDMLLSSQFIQFKKVICQTLQVFLLVFAGGNISMFSILLSSLLICTRNRSERYQRNR